jgi:two-component system LytT family response regulator
MSQQFSVILIDDEFVAREHIKNLLRMAYPQVVIVAEASTCEEAVSVLKKYTADICFLDVMMAECTGFAILDAVASHITIRPVFITAHEHYAVKAFQYHALDYLLKPIYLNTLKQTIDRVLNERKKGADNSSINGFSKNAGKQLLVMDRSGWTLVYLNDIIYFEARGSYCKIHLQLRDALTSSKNLKYYEELLQANTTFLKIHRSYYVNGNTITGYNGLASEITLLNQTRLPVSLTAKKMLHLLEEARDIQR